MGRIEKTTKVALTALALLATTQFQAQADIRVGILLSATGPNASLGIPYKNMFTVVPTTVGSEKIDFIYFDDASDPSNAVKNARKMITDEKVDLIIGGSGVPAAVAVSEVAADLKVPFLAFSPATPAVAKNPWTFSIPQPATVMMRPVVQRLKATGVKSVAFIGFNDPWGDLVYNGFAPAAEAAGIKVVANERYARPDTSVTGQVLKIMSLNPDAVVVGGSGVPSTLPQVTLVERGYKGAIYHNHGVINRDFIRIGAKGVENAIAPTGPVMVAEQLPDSNPIKKVSLDFIQLYESKFGPGTRNAFSAYAYDAYLLFTNAATRAMKGAKPGTAEFREALRNELEKSHEVVGTHAVYNMSPTDHTGVDERSVVLVRVEDGNWKLLK